MMKWNSAVGGKVNISLTVTMIFVNYRLVSSWYASKIAANSARGDLGISVSPLAPSQRTQREL